MTFLSDHREIDLASFVCDLPEPVIAIKYSGVILHCNDATVKKFGYPLEELVGKNISILMPEPEASNHDGYLRKYLETNKSRILGTGRKVYAKGKNGTVFPVYLSVSEQILNNERVFIGLLRDLSEVDLLMKEVVHRVKNNFQVLDSILALQQNSEDSGDSKALLQGIRNRIFALSLVHNQIYQDTISQSLDLCSYVRSLIGYLSDSIPKNSKIHVKVCADQNKLNVNAKQATACGSIINELVANSIKYDKDRNNPFTLFCILKKIETNIYLFYSDTGDFYADFGVENSSSQAQSPSDLLNKN